MAISEFFPKTHSKYDNPTYFYEQICNAVCAGNKTESVGTKLHTIRANYTFWEKRIDEVKAGNAVLVIYSWTGKPYRSTTQNLFVFGKRTVEITEFVCQKFDTMKDNRLYILLKDEVEIGVQKIKFSRDIFHPYIEHYLGSELTLWIEELARNDGLTPNDWLGWFKNYDLSQSMAIICFTKFRY